ncbi:MAG: NAD+ synthase, partial [Bdellovibrio sp.]
YGDLCGGLMPIGDLTKTQVFALAGLYNVEKETFPASLMSRPPSAELRPNQKDEDQLPPYSQLDEAIVRLVEKCLPPKGKIDDWLLRALFRSEFKRWQAPPILKVSEHGFGRGRRWPVAHQALEE